MQYDSWRRRYAPHPGYDSELRRRYEGFERARFWNEQGPEGDGFAGGPDAGELEGFPDLAAYGPARYGLGPYYERLRRRRREDAEVRHDIEEALFYDTWVNADAITVEVVDGVATLRGELPSYEEVRFATDDAWDVEGVVGVRCELTVDDR